MQETLPLAPTVGEQVELPAQSKLHESPQLPVHVLWSLHASVQLPPSPPQLVELKLHVMPGAHMQVAPLHVGAVELPPPHATAKKETTENAMLTKK